GAKGRQGDGAALVPAVGLSPVSGFTQRAQSLAKAAKVPASQHPRSPLRPFALPALVPHISSDKLPLTHNVTFHCIFDLFSRRTCRCVQSQIQRKQPELVMMHRSWRWTRAAIAHARKVVLSLDRTAGSLFDRGHALTDFSNVTRQVVDHPVRPGSPGRVRVLAD